jgi:hypothetical protein
MTRYRRRIAFSCGLITLTSALVWAAVAAVSSKAEVVPARRSPGNVVMIPLSLSCAQQVAGVNGEIRYNADYFGEPTVSAATGASGFTALGSEIEPGKFRFVLYKSPTAALDLTKPVLNLALVTKTIPHAVSSTQVTYALSAAAKPDGTSYLDDVRFSPVTIQFQSDASDWNLFR